MPEDFDRCYGAVKSRDARFDGWFFTAVTSTGIYCRPSCPAMTPKPSNVRFFPSAAAAQSAGFRACLRCRPDAAPGSPAWNARADVVARAMKLIADGAVDRHGVRWLAAELGYSERQLHRLLVAEVGTGVTSLARAQRAQTARLLLETTDLPVSAIAFAAGFASIRQFNDTVRAVFAASPSALRKTHHRHGPRVAGAVSLRLPYRAPFDGRSLLAFLGLRAVPGVESLSADGTYRRSMALPHGDGVVELSTEPDYIRAVFFLQDLRDLTTAVSRCRRLLDLDADPVAIDEALGADPLLRPLVARAPGRRLPGTVDGPELAVRAVIGQQVSVAGARTVAGRLVRACGRPLGDPRPPVTHRFPQADEIAGAPPDSFAMPAARREALRSLAGALAEGSLVIGPGSEPTELTRRLESLPGLGRWTSSYVVMRALGDPDAFLPTDLGIRRALAARGEPADPASVGARSERWRPWRAYAMTHLWAAGSAPEPADPAPEPQGPRLQGPQPQGPRLQGPQLQGAAMSPTATRPPATRPPATRPTGRADVAGPRGGRDAAGGPHRRAIPTDHGPLVAEADDRALTHLYLPGTCPDDGTADTPDPPAHLAAAVAQLDEYLAGERRSFDLPLAAAGTAFQRQVWSALADIPYGSTISYAELARRVGRPTAYRAVGQANGANPLPIVLPCHRVVASGGGIGGYGGGLPLKRWLLAREGAGVPRTADHLTPVPHSAAPAGAGRPHVARRPCTG